MANPRGPPVILQRDGGEGYRKVPNPKAVKPDIDVVANPIC